MTKFYFTFSSEELKYLYISFESESLKEAKAAVIEQFGRVWEKCYEEEEFLPLIKKHNLTEYIWN